MKNKNENKNQLTREQRTTLLKTLKTRFEKNMNRHKGLEWTKLQTALQSNDDKLWSVYQMESTGGEPDVVVLAITGNDKKKGEAIICDCSPESPKGRRSLCYDRAALDARKEFKPQDSAMEMAAAIGIEILTEELYQELQKLGEFDTKTSSWLKTPDAIRKLGGAICAERRYNRVFVCHNSAPSYYASRGFRGWLKI